MTGFQQIRSETMPQGMSIEELRAAVARAFPELARAEVTLLDTGWDCAALEVDRRLIFKFPRHDAAARALEMQARLLDVIRPAVTLPVPALTLHPGPPSFSRHEKLEGEHLVTAQYEALPLEARERLAADLALFYAELHRLDLPAMERAGARAIRPWLAPEAILARVWPVLPAGLRSYAEAAIGAWSELPADPHGVTFGFFDGHGWNMAFDHAQGRLNGIYDFGDAGFGPLHQEFIYSNFIARDLTERLVTRYESLTGRALDRARIELLSSVLRLSELAEYADDPEHAPMMLDHVARWTER